jgi:hypothetical protein
MVDYVDGGRWIEVLDEGVARAVVGEAYPELEVRDWRVGDCGFYALLTEEPVLLERGPASSV